MKLLFLLFILIFMGCSPKFKIYSDTPFQGDFKNYKSFKFFNPENIPGSNFSFEEADKKALFDAVADEMKSRGYVSFQDAELMIKIQGGTKNAVEIQNDNRYNNNYHSPYGYNNYNNRYGGYDSYNDRPRDESKKETSIIIDIIDIKMGKIVWQGVGIGTFGKKVSLNEIKIREVVTNIFLEYPHIAGS